MAELKPWFPWEPLEDFEEEMHFLLSGGGSLDRLAGEYLAVPELAALGFYRDGTPRKFVADQTGHPHPRVMLIGEAPGGDEDEAGEPFVGVAGRLLNETLAEAGVSRTDDCWATNPLKHRPIDDAGKNRTPTPREIELARPFLLREIELLDPLIVVTLGNVPTETVWPDAPGILTCQGEWRELPDGRAHLPVVHPSFALRDRRGPGMEAFRSGLAKLGEMVALIRTPTSEELAS